MSVRHVPSEWAKRPASAKLEKRVVEAIARRRRQMLLHSCLYYRLDAPIVEDHVWTRWAQQLAGLQQKFGYRIGFYDAVFRDWNGSSGFHLPADNDVVRVALRLRDDHQSRLDLLS
jgi:hypothetical protein